MNPHLSASDIPGGFTFAATHCGIKRSRLDLGILVSDTLATTAAMFTTNQIVAAPVIASREHLRQSRGRMRGIIVNSGNANCCTKQDGYPASVATPVLLSRLCCELPRRQRIDKARRNDGENFAAPWSCSTPFQLIAPGAKAKKPGHTLRKP